MSRKAASLYYPLLVYLSLSNPLSLFSMIPALFFLGNRLIKRYTWVYYVLGTFTLLIIFFYFQMTTRNELIAIITASIVALLLREADQVPFWAILVGWLAILGWFSGPLAVFCVLIVVLAEWEWYKKIGVILLLLVLLFFPIPMRTAVWWLPRSNVMRETQQHFGFHNYEGQYHQMGSEGEEGPGSKSDRVSFAYTKTWMDSIVDWTVFILLFLMVILLVRLIMMLRQIRHQVSPYVIRAVWITGIATVVISSIVFFYRAAFQNFEELPPNSPVTAIIRQFLPPTVVSTVNPEPVDPVQTIIRSIPLWAQITGFILILLCLGAGIIFLIRLILHTYQIKLVPEQEITPVQIKTLKTTPTPLTWEELQALPVREIVDKVYTNIRVRNSQTDHLTPYEFLKSFPSEALRIWTDWIVLLHYAPGNQLTLPSLETVQQVFSTLLI